MGKSAGQASLRMWVQTPRTKIRAEYTAQGCHGLAPLWSKEDETGVSPKARGLVSLLFLHGKNQESYLTSVHTLCARECALLHVHTHICQREREGGEEREREKRGRRGGERTKS